MITLFDKHGRAIIRIYDDSFVAYAESKHLGWLNGKAVHDQHGRHIGWLDEGILRDSLGRIVATDYGSTYPLIAGKPGRPGKPGISGLSGRFGNSSSWSSKNYKEFFIMN
jgi:hypothetical protein